MSSEDQRDVLVDFNGKAIKVDNEADAGCIVKALKAKPLMTSFRLSGNTVGVEGAGAIGSQLTTNKYLQKCIFSDMFTGRMVDEIAPALTHISLGIMSSGAQLTELDLSDNAFGPRGVVGVTKLLSSPACFTLKILRMNNQGLGHQGARYLAESLSKGLESSKGLGPKLKHFSAGRNRLENVGACLLADVFSQMGSLEELHLYQNGIGIHGIEGVKALASAISKNPQMRVLNLSDNSLKEDGGIEISKILHSIPHLKELILDDCLIRSRGCRVLARSLECDKVVPELNHLSLYGNEIRRDAGVSLALSLASKSHLTKLSLNANEFGPEGVERILSALESISLLPALEAGVLSKTEAEDDVDDDELDPFHRAFNEDQGSEDEDADEDEDYDDDEVQYDDDEYERDEEDYGEEYEGESEADQENSPVPVKSDPAPPSRPSGDTLIKASGGSTGTGGFSFLSCLSELQKSAQSKSNLFSVLNSSDTATSGGGGSRLFASQSATPKLGGLFAPPKLNVASTHASPGGLGLSGLFSTPPPPPQQKSFNDAASLEALKAALADTENDDLLASLVDKIAVRPAATQGSLKPEDVSSATPETIVRLAFRLAQRSPACRDFASDLLFAACTRSTDSRASLVSASGRAVNRILVHLGAIKPDRSDAVERRAAADVQHDLPDNVRLVSALLRRHGHELSADVRASLALLISEHRHDNSAFEGLLDALEGKMSALSVS
ncbi:unnamed protein product [Mesocestoides corti]|uniref:Endonuclease n=2 Tax=Mesocestoides corti TaxID=53468 RepID=A0A0R3UKV6_MESCO|nr:unnamed protein product [Mesocestoides corti]